MVIEASEGDAGEGAFGRSRSGVRGVCLSEKRILFSSEAVKGTAPEGRRRGMVFIFVMRVSCQENGNEEEAC